MKLNLKRPLAFFDLESTGVNVASDRIVEICILKAMPDGSEEIKTLRINPQIPIPIEASLVHGIYDADIAKEPIFKQVGEELARFLDNCDLAGYNSNRFDIPMLVEEFLRAGVDFDIDNRFFVDAVLYIAKTGCGWRQLPMEYGKWKSVWQRFDRWSKNGIWEKVFDKLKSKNEETVAIDSTSVRVHQDGMRYIKKLQTREPYRKK